MKQTVIKITWHPAEIEFIPLRDIPKIDDHVKTHDYWGRDPKPVEYNAVVRRWRSTLRGASLSLHYSRLQSDPRAKQGRWGQTDIAWSSDGSAKATWKDDDDRSFNCSAPHVAILGLVNATRSLRSKTSVLIVPRPKQQELRNALLALGKACALTGETEANALEAAHIVPVKAGGMDDIANAILLRADIHRLFDAGKIWFDVTSSEAVPKGPRLSDSYKKILKDSPRLNASDFWRVRESLVQRATLPGGAGIELKTK